MKSSCCWRETLNRIKQSDKRKITLQGVTWLPFPLFFMTSLSHVKFNRKSGCKQRRDMQCKNKKTTTWWSRWRFEKKKKKKKEKVSRDVVNKDTFKTTTWLTFISRWLLRKHASNFNCLLRLCDKTVAKTIVKLAVSRLLILNTWSVINMNCNNSCLTVSCCHSSFSCWWSSSSES